MFASIRINERYINVEYDIEDNKFILKSIDNIYRNLDLLDPKLVSEITDTISNKCQKFINASTLFKKWISNVDVDFEDIASIASLYAHGQLESEIHRCNNIINCTIKEKIK